MALFDCASNEKCCSVDGGQGIGPLFSSPPRGIWQLKNPHPREFAIQGKKNTNARGSAPGGGGGLGAGGIDWCIASVSESQYKQKHSDDDVCYSDDPGEFQTTGVFLHA